jgi:hypothetical protein
VVAALGVWALNDHVLKEAWGNVLTGKLSDVVSLMVFPLVPAALYEWAEAALGRVPRHTARVIVLSSVAAATVMAGINTLETWAWAYEHGLGAAQWPFRALWGLVSGDGLPPLGTVVLTMDPTDLLCLPAVVFPLWMARDPRLSSRCP